MKHVVLLDPGLVLPEMNPDPRVLALFWLRLSEWTLDGRARLGSRSYSGLTHMYAEIDNVEYVPTSLKRTVHSSIGKILSKPPIQHDCIDRNARFTAEYLPDHSRQTLLDDLIGSFQSLPIVLGSDPSFWDSAPARVGCIPAPPASVVVHFAPGLPTAEERLTTMKEWFSARKIVIVGGQVDRNIQQSLVDEVGVDSTKLSWIPSEYNKKASNIPAVIKGLDPGHSIVICIMGKVGHATSGSVETSCRKNGHPYRFVEHASSLRELLEKLFDEESSPGES